MTPSLRRAFRTTTYEAEGAIARIGRRGAALDALLAARGARVAGFVTAWNPFSRRMPCGVNDRMQDRLRALARGRVLGEGFGRGRCWAEHHLLVAGDPRALRVMARRFRQHAIVIVAPRHAARLVEAQRR